MSIVQKDLSVFMFEINTAVVQSKAFVGKGMKPVKAIGRSFYNVFGKATENWENGVHNGSFYDSISTLGVASTSEEINAVYRDIGTSCLTGASVGEFYSLIGIECLYTSKARCLINRTDRTFYKVYGEDHYVLSSLLLLMGYKCRKSWLKGKNEVIFDLLRSGFVNLPMFIDGDITDLEKFLFENSDLAICNHMASMEEEFWDSLPFIYADDGLCDPFEPAIDDSIPPFTYDPSVVYSIEGLPF